MNIPMLRHRHLTNRVLSRYIDGELPPRSRAAVEQTAANCDHCRRNLETLQQAVLMLNQLPELRPSRSFVMERAPADAPALDRDTLRMPRFQLPQWVYAGAASAAGLALALMIAADATGMVRGEAASGVEFQASQAATQERTVDAEIPLVPALAGEPGLQEAVELGAKAAREVVPIEREAAMPEAQAMAAEESQPESASAVQDAPALEIASAQTLGEVPLEGAVQSDQELAKQGPAGQLPVAAAEPQESKPPLSGSRPSGRRAAVLAGTGRRRRRHRRRVAGGVGLAAQGAET